MRGGPHGGTTPQFDFREFEGFAAPGSTQVPDIFFDKIMVHLSNVELRVLLYFFRRTFGFKKFSDNISISQMVNGIETRDGKRLDYGCGLSKSGVTKGLRGLLKKNLIVATRRSDAKRGNLPTNYALNMHGAERGRHSDDIAADDSEIDEDTQHTPPLSPGVNKGVSTTVYKGSPQRAQALSLSVDTQQTVTNKQNDKVVNVANDQTPIRDRSIAGRSAVIAERAIRKTYHLTDDQIGRVHWLVQKQVDILGAATRNHAFYVKRAAEAVRDGNDTLLDQMLSELKQASAEIGIGSRPAYFHTMYREAREKTGAGSTTVARTAADRESPRADSDARARLIADAESRGFSVPDYIRNADPTAVNHWWAGLIDGLQNA